MNGWQTAYVCAAIKILDEMDEMYKCRYTEEEMNEFTSGLSESAKSQVQRRQQHFWWRRDWPNISDNGREYVGKASCGQVVKRLKKLRVLLEEVIEYGGREEVQTVSRKEGQQAEE